MAFTSRIRLGIVGCGAHAHVHAEAARLSTAASIDTCCDIDLDRAREFATRHGCGSWHGSIEEMLSHSKLDGVILCTWPIQHASQIETCLARGISNILCEKALFTSAEEARRIIELVRRNGAHLVEASMHRHHPAIRKLETLLAQGELGAVDSIRAAFHNREPADALGEAPADNWRHQSACGGGVTYDWLHYLVDSCNHFSGSRPKRAYATGNATASGLIYRIYGHIEYENGSVGIVENSKLASFNQTLQITCAHGILQLPIAWAIQGEVTITQSRRKPLWDFLLKDTYQIEHTNAYVLELEDFCRVVTDRAVPRVPLEDSVANACTTEALVTSLREGRVVDVNLAEI
jgi:predicted dehydrogenase